MKKHRFSGILSGILYAAAANAWIFIRLKPLVCIPALLAVLILNIFTGVPYKKDAPARIKIERHGTECLRSFLISATVSVLYHVWLGIEYIGTDNRLFIFSAIWCVALLSVLFWNGIICVYCTSVQLGFKLRLLGVLGWLIFPFNIVLMFIICKKCTDEIAVETEKSALNRARQQQRICKTRYPILLVHGVFFRDNNLLEYWGRIPNELRRNGAIVYHGEHQSAAAVEDSAAELTERIKRIVEETGCEKVNIIAHSKGGLDCRCAMMHGAAPYIASLTTINTPHRGCEFADYLLEKVPASIQKKVEDTYNAAAKKLGDKTPDFMAAVRDLTAARCSVMDRTFTAPEGVLCRSVGSEMRKPSGGMFPLNYSYHLVKYFNGPNDGLVAADSFEWGEDYTYLTVRRGKGISHCDVIDLTHENLADFDAREFYVQLVSDLRERGL